MYYTARLSHALLLLLIGLALLMVGNAVPRILRYCLIAGGIAWAMILPVWLVIVLDTRARFYESVAQYAHEVGGLPADRLDLVKIQHPTLPMRWRRGELVPMFEDSGATMANFERFMRHSNHSTTASERDWSDRQEYRRILDWLIRYGYVQDNSANGNRSWLWYPAMFDRAWARYMLHDVPELDPSPSVITSRYDPHPNVYHADSVFTERK